MKISDKFQLSLISPKVTNNVETTLYYSPKPGIVQEINQNDCTSQTYESYAYALKEGDILISRLQPIKRFAWVKNINVKSPVYLAKSGYIILRPKENVSTNVYWKVVLATLIKNKHIWSDESMLGLSANSLRNAELFEFPTCNGTHELLDCIIEKIHSSYKEIAILEEMQKQVFKEAIKRSDVTNSHSRRV